MKRAFNLGCNRDDLFSLIRIQNLDKRTTYTGSIKYANVVTLYVMFNNNTAPFVFTTGHS